MQSSSLVSRITGNTNLKLVVKVVGLIVLTVIVVYNIICFADSPSTYLKDLGGAVSLLAHG